MNTETLIQIENLSKQFVAEKALRHIDLTIPCGSIVGFVGANGAEAEALQRRCSIARCQNRSRSRRFRPTRGPTE
jgi:ABC-type branched-subunit amino acid transport system ATPase component